MGNMLGISELELQVIPKALPEEEEKAEEGH